MKKNTSPTELLLAKLERPIHISYISEYLLKLPIEVCQTKINELVKSDLVEESQYGKGYYVRKKMK